MATFFREIFDDWVWTNVAGTFGLQVVGLVLSFGVSLVLARSVGAAGLGTYEYVIAVVAALSPVAVMGVDKLLRREVAALQEEGRWAALRRLFGWSVGWVTGVSLLIGGGAAAVFYGPLEGLPGTRGWTLALGLVLLPLVAWIRVARGGLQGLRRAAVSLIPEEVVIPGVLLVGLAVVYGVRGLALSADVAVGLRVVGAVVGLMGIAVVLWRGLPGEVRTVDEAGANGASGATGDGGKRADGWWGSALVLMAVAGLGALNARVDTILLGYLGRAELVGFYAVALRAAGLILLIFYAMNQTLSGEFSRLETAGEAERLRRTAHRAQWVVLAVALPVAGALLVVGEGYLRWFGPEFVAASGALGILAVGRLLATCTGLSGYLLMMTGHERAVAVVEAGALALNVGLNLALIPRWGLEGAAVATALSFVLSGAVQAALVRRRLGFGPSVVGALTRWWGRRG